MYMIFLVIVVSLIFLLVKHFIMKLVSYIFSATVTIGNAATIIPVGTLINWQSGRVTKYVNVTMRDTNEIVPAHISLTSFNMDFNPSGLPPMHLYGIDEDSVPKPGISLERVADGGVGRITSEPEYLGDDPTGVEGLIHIGPRTPLVRYYNSVDFIWNTANYKNKLILNSSFEWFNTTACTPGSVVSVPITEDGLIEVQTFLKLGDSIFSDDDHYQLSSDTFLVDVALHIYLKVTEALAMAGVPCHKDRFGFCDPDSFENCRAVRELLPPILMAFSETDFEVLYPADYTLMIGEDRCRLYMRSGPVFRGSEPFHMNPLAFKGRNVRFTPHEMFVCRSAIDSDITSVN